MTQEVVYHTDIGLPRGFVPPTGRVLIDYGMHARDEARFDRYGNIRLPKSLSLGRMKVIEVGIREIDGIRRVSKILFRGRLDDERDLCIVLVPKGNRPWFCKTVWVNSVNDTHRTLQRNRYAVP